MFRNQHPIEERHSQRERERERERDLLNFFLSFWNSQLEMMGLGYLGEGSGEHSSSSISNLSALAPPFTVDRLNLNPMLSSNPVLNYSELSHAVEPYSHTSQFAVPSAPRHELDYHPTETTSMSLNDYQISNSIYHGPSGVHPFVYGGGVKHPYYSPSVPPMNDEGSSIIEYDGQSSNMLTPSGLSVSSQFGYNQSVFDLEYGPRWADNDMRVKTVGLGGDLSSKNVNVDGSQSYKIQVSQGICDIPFSQKSQEVLGVPCGNLNRVSDSEVHNRQLALGNLEDRPFLEQNVDLLPYDYTKPCITASDSIFPEGQSCEMQQNFSNFQNSCGPYDKFVLPFDPSFTSSSSVMRPYPALLSRPIPSVDDFMGKDVAYYRTTHTDNVAVVDFEQSCPSKRRDSSPIPSYCLKVNSHLPASEIDLTVPMQSKHNLPRESKARVGCQLPDINVSSGFSMSCDSNQVVYSAMDSSDFVNHCNPSVDSPCWKGAVSSLFSAFDVGSRDSLKKNLDQCYGFDHSEHQNPHFLCDATRAFSEKVGVGNNNDCNSRGRNSAYSLQNTFYANSLSREQNLSDDAKAFVGTSTMTSGEEIQLSNQQNFQNEHSQTRNYESSFDMKSLDTKHLNVEEDAGLTLNDVSEGGSVAVCAAEKVLASPSSQEAGYECAKPLSDTKFDFRTTIKAMHNLSELLLCHLSHETCCSLEEKNMEIIKNIISNLNACTRNNIHQETNAPKLKKCFRDTSAIIEESHCVDKISDGHCMTNETFNSHFQPDYKHTSEGKKDESPFFSPLRGREGIKRNDDMTKAIKKILEGNFHCNEEMSSQALLFKSLWLEAEANLCFVGYKARFDQMKIEMGQIEAKTLKESENVAEMLSKIRSTPDPNTDSRLTPKTHGGTSVNPASKNSFISSMTENANDIGDSITARFKILKSRGDSIRSINVEKERQLETGDGEHAGSIMERFNILKPREANCNDLEPVLVRSNLLKPREDNLISTNKEKEPHPEMVNDEHAESVMARFNILKSREVSSTINVKDEQQSEMVDVEFCCKKNVGVVKNDLSEAEVFYVSPKPQQTGILSENEFGSQLNGCGCEPPKELHFSVPDDPIVGSFDNGNVMNQCHSRLHDSSLSSDWEHVQKDYLAWKNL